MQEPNRLKVQSEPVSKKGDVAQYGNKSQADNVCHAKCGYDEQ